MYVAFRLFVQAHSVMDIYFVGRGDVVFCNPNAIRNAFPLDLFMNVLNVINYTILYL